MICSSGTTCTSIPKLSVFPESGNMREPEMLTDTETLKMVTSSFDPKKGTVQAAAGSIDGIPTFPYTKVLIMPPDLWWQGKGFMNTKGMIRSSWQRFRNSCGTSHHLQCNVLLAHGGCVPLGFCAVDHGRKLRIVLNPLCNGSASTNTSSVRYGSSIRCSLLRPQPAAPAAKVIQPRQHFGRDDSFKLFIQEVDGQDILGPGYL